MSDVVLTQTVNTFVATYLTSALLKVWMDGGHLHFDDIADLVLPAEVPVAILDELAAVAEIWVDTNQAPQPFVEFLLDQLVVAWCINSASKAAP